MADATQTYDRRNFQEGAGKIFLMPETSEAIVRKSVPRTLLKVSLFLKDEKTGLLRFFSFFYHILLCLFFVLMVRAYLRL